jgi:hypothetical protein
MSQICPNRDLIVIEELSSNYYKELEMDTLNLGRRKVLRQIAFSAAGILGLSTASEVFAYIPDAILSVRVNLLTYNRQGRKTSEVVLPGATVTISCPRKGIRLSQQTDSKGKVYFNLSRYYPNKNGSDTWKVTVSYRGVNDYLEETMSRGCQRHLFSKLKRIV